MTVPSSVRAKTAATALAVVALAAGLVAGVHSAPVEIAGGGEAAPSQLGSSFADLAMGTETAEPSETPTADTVEPTPADEAADRVEPAPPEPMAEVPRQAQPRATPPEPPQPTAPTAVPVQTTDPTLPAMPELTTADAPEPVAPVPAAPAEPAETAQEPASEVITGESLPPGVVVSSRRPPSRTEAFEARHRRPDPPPQQRQTRQPEPTRQAQQQPTPTRQAQSQPTNTQRGNAHRTERAGAQADTGGSSSGATGQRQASQTGNAAASNYPGQVMARLSRVPRPSVRAAGSAVVSFSVSGSGGLAGAGIARSSGSPALDRAAVQLVQRAAPFPAPPPGAQRQFSITVAGR